jgi:hypothetical protein
VTNDEILKARQLIADLRNILFDFLGVTDAEKLLTLVPDKIPWILDRVERFNAPPIIAVFGPEDFEVWYRDIVVVSALAEMAKRRHDYSAKLVEFASKKLPNAFMVLERVASELANQSLKFSAQRSINV